MPLNLTMSNTTVQSTTSLSFSDGTFLTWFNLSMLLHFIGAFANLVLILALGKDRISNGGTHVLVTNIATANFLLCAAIIPAATAGVYVHRYHELPSQFCPVVQSLYYAGIAGVFWGEVNLALNRVVAVCFPLLYIYLKSKRSSIILVSVSWAISLTVALLMFSETASTSTNPDGKCGYRATKSAGIVFPYLLTTVPYTIIGCASFMIFSAGRCKMRRYGTTVQKVKQRSLGRRLEIARAMLGSVLWCCLCTLPATVTSVAPAAFTHIPSWTLWVRLTYSCAFVGSPVIFFLMSAVYRKAVRQLFTGFISSKKSSRSSECVPNSVSTEQSGQLPRLQTGDGYPHAGQSSNFLLTPL